MSRQITLTDELLAYLREVSLREPDALRKLREETAKLPMAGMQISPDQGQFMALLVRLIGARRRLAFAATSSGTSISSRRRLAENVLPRLSERNERGPPPPRA